MFILRLLWFPLSTSSPLSSSSLDANESKKINFCSSFWMILFSSEPTERATQNEDTIENSLSALYVWLYVDWRLVVMIQTFAVQIKTWMKERQAKKHFKYSLMFLLLFLRSFLVCHSVRRFDSMFICRLCVNRFNANKEPLYDGRRAQHSTESKSNEKQKSDLKYGLTLKRLK